MAIPPINEQEFLKKLGQISVTKSATGLGKQSNTATQKPPAPAGGLQAQINAINDAKAANKAELAKQGTVKKIAIKALTNPVTQNVLKPLNLLSGPMRFGIGTLREIADVYDSSPNTKASVRDLIKNTKDPAFGFGTAFPIPGWQGRVIGFIGDVALDPLTYASFGANVGAKSVIKYGGKATAVSTRTALGGIKTVSGRGGRTSLAIFAKKHLEDLRKLGVDKAVALSDDAILKIQKDVAAFGKSKLPGWLADDIGIRGPGVYFFNSRVKLPGSGTVGKFLERDLINRSRLFLVSDAKLNPFQYVHKAITPKGTGVIADAGPQTILDYRVKLANGSLSPKEADIAITIVGADDVRRVSNSKALEEAQQIAIDLVDNPLLEKNALNLHRLIEKPAITRTFEEELIIQQWEKVTKTIRNLTDARMKEVDPDFVVGEIDNWFPHMESRAAIDLRAKIGEEAFDELVPRKTLSDSRRSASSFRGRYTEEGDVWFGHTLTKEDLNAEDLNRLARNPTEVSDRAALDFDLFETDARLVLQKYIRHYAEQMGHAEFMKFILKEGSEYMKYFEKSVPMATRHAMSRLHDESVDALETVFRNLNNHSAPLREQFDLYNALPQNTPEEIAAAQKVLLDAVDDGSVHQIPFHDASASFDNMLENVDGVSPHSLIVQERIYLQEDYKNIERQRKELGELVEEFGNDLTNPVIADRQAVLRDSINDYTNKLDKHFRDMNELKDVHSVLPSFSSTRTITSSTPTPVISSVQDVLVRGTSGEASIDDVAKSLRTIENEHAAFQIDEKGAERILSEKSSEFGLSDIGKRVRIADKRIADARKITDRVQQRLAITEASFWVQDVLHQHLAIMEYSRLQKLASKFGITLGDNIVNEIFEANARRFVHESRRATSELNSVIQSLVEYRRIVASSSKDPSTLLTVAAIRQHMGNELFDSFTKYGRGINFIDSTTNKLDAESWFNKMLGPENKINKENGSYSFNRNEALLYNQLDAHVERLQELQGKGLIYGRNEGNGVFGSYDTVRHLEIGAKNSAELSEKAAQKIKPEPVSLKVKRKKEFDSLPTKIKAVYNKYVREQKEVIKTAKVRIGELSTEKQIIEKSQLLVRKKHFEKSEAFEKAFSKALYENAFEKNPKSAQELFDFYINNFFKDSNGFIDSFKSAHKPVFDFLQIISKKESNLPISPSDLNIMLSILDEFNFDINVRKLVRRVKNAGRGLIYYNEFETSLYGILGQEVSRKIDEAAKFGWLDIEARINQLDKNILLLKNQVLTTEQALRTILPSEFVNSPKGKMLVNQAMGFEDDAAINLFPNATALPVEDKNLSDVYLEISRIENNDVYPFYKSQQKRVNVLHELSNLDGHKVDWTMNGVLPATHLGQPLIFTADTWDAFVSAKNFIGLSDDEVGSIITWLRNPQVVAVIAPDKTNMVLSDEFLLSKFVDHVANTQPMALAKETVLTVRQKALKEIWTKSDGGKELIKLKQYKNLVLEKNVAKQSEDAIRLGDDASTQLNEAERQRRIQMRSRLEWTDSQSSNLFKRTESLIALQKNATTELEKNVNTITDTATTTLRDFNTAAKKIDEILDTPLERKSVQQLEDEVKILEQLRKERIKTPYTDGEFRNLVNARKKQISLFKKIDKEPTPTAVPEVADDIARRNAELSQMRASKNYTDDEIAARQYLLDKRINDKQAEKRRLNIGPKVDREIIDSDQIPGAGTQVSYGSLEDQSKLSPVFEQPSFTPKPVKADRVLRIDQPRPTTFLNQSSEILDEESLRNALINMSDDKLTPLAPNTTPLASVSESDVVENLDVALSSASLNKPLNLNQLVEVQKRIREAVDIITAGFEARTGLVTGPNKIKFIDNYLSGKGPDVSGVHREAMELFREAYQMMDGIAKRGVITPIEEILVDSILKESVFYSTAGRLSDDELAARLTAGAAGKLLVDDVEVPFPELASTTAKMIEEGWVALGKKYPNIVVSEDLAKLWQRADYFSDPDFVRYLQNYIGGFTKFHKAYATLTPGFHIRNFIGNAFQFVLAGGKMQHLRPATEIHFQWIEAYKKGVPWETFLAGVDEQYRAAVNIARDAMHGSGGGIYGDIFHAVNRGSRLYDWALTRKSQKLGQQSDNMARFVLGFDSAMQGMDVNAAIARVRKFYFDYEDLSKVDKAVKQIIPFWIWTSRNLPLQIENMWLNPKPYLIYESFKRNVRDKETEAQEPLPPFLQEVGAFQLPGLGAYAAPDLNFTRVEQSLNQLVNPKKLGTNVTPLFRAPIEQILGQNLFNDEEMEGGMERLIAGLQSIIVPVATGDRLLNSYGKAKTNAWLGFFGSPIKDN